jgi:hypothetical protein
VESRPTSWQNVGAAGHGPGAPHLPTPDEQLIADRAQNILERECLNRLGVPWSGADEEELRTGSMLMVSKLTERFGLVDEEQAARYGYHPPPWTTLGQAAAKDRGPDHHDDIPDEVAPALFGQAATVNGRPVPKGGCRGEANRQLLGGATWAGDPLLVTKLENEATTRASNDARTADARIGWSACMKRAGHTYDTPGQAMRDQRWANSRQPTETELGVAVADTRCKRESGYLRALLAATTQHQQTLVADHAKELGALKRLRKIHSRNAARVLASTNQEGR